MISQSKITLLQLLLLFITAVGLMDHVTVLPFLLEASGRDSWLTVLLTGGVFLLWTPLIFLIAKKTNQQPIYLWLNEHYNRFISTTLMFFTTAYFLFFSAITVYELATWTLVTYLPETPSIIIILIFSLACLLLSITNIETIAIVNGILLPLVIIFGIFVALGNIPNKDYILLFPILEHGFEPIIKGSVYAGAGFFEMFMIVFAHHKINGEMRLKPLLLTSIGFISLMLGPTIGAITEFGPAGAMNLSFPAYEEWSLLSFGRFIEHVDFLSIYQWFTGAFIRVSLGLYLISEVFQIKQKKNRIKISIIFTILLIGLTSITVETLTYHKFLRDWILPISFS
ncbi:MAG TPA: endospore germination permease, partial [Bacilli bacterium]|nr:endospore germination permease [Bacilli bacterium]